ncbi:MAG: dTDP-4-dehydrorhamnose reductase [Megamonas funiformis]|nr:dTDP-4-dehydrorhamnose reductase [Megamonas funiformis]
MKVLVTGYTGQLGFDVIRELKARNIECIGTTRNEFSLTDTEKMQAFVKAYKPDAVIHCAAYMNVNEAEDNKDLCMLVNYSSTKELAKICKEIDAKMIYISTDYVFAGSGEGFYEINNDKEPQNVYGKSKLKGELAIQKILDKYFIIRTSWLFGINGNNFIKYVLSEQKKGNKLRIVNDQIGSPTYTVDLAKLLCDMALSDKYGIYHATNEGICSWYDFACEIFKQADIKINVKPVSSTAFPTKAIRPHNSRMSKKCLDEVGFNRLPTWQNALTKYLKEINK